MAKNIFISEKENISMETIICLYTTFKFTWLVLKSHVSFLEEKTGISLSFCLPLSCSVPPYGATTIAWLNLNTHLSFPKSWLHQRGLRASLRQGDLRGHGFHSSAPSFPLVCSYWSGSPKGPVVPEPCIRRGRLEQSGLQHNCGIRSLEMQD